MGHWLPAMRWSLHGSGSRWGSGGWGGGGGRGPAQGMLGGGDSGGFFAMVSTHL